MPTTLEIPPPLRALSTYEYLGNRGEIYRSLLLAGFARDNALDAIGYGTGTTVDCRKTIICNQNQMEDEMQYLQTSMRMKLAVREKDTFLSPLHFGNPRDNSDLFHCSQYVEGYVDGLLRREFDHYEHMELKKASQEQKHEIQEPLHHHIPPEEPVPDVQEGMEENGMEENDVFHENSDIETS